MVPSAFVPFKFVFSENVQTSSSCFAWLSKRLAGMRHLFLWHAGVTWSHFRSREEGKSAHARPLEKSMSLTTVFIPRASLAERFHSVPRHFACAVRLQSMADRFRMSG